MRFAEWVKRGGCLPNIPRLKAEITAISYTFVNGKFRVVEKDHIKELLGYSPDFTDALCQTFAWHEMPRGSNMPQVLLPKDDLYGIALTPPEIGMRNHGKVVCEFDPFRDMKDENFA